MSHLFRFLGNYQDGIWTIDGSELHHLKKVLRLRPGDLVEVFNGCGYSGHGALLEASGELATVGVESTKFSPKMESSLILAIGALKPGTLEETLPFLVELGVDHIHTFLQDHAAKSRIHDKAQERWQRIIVASSKQCKRPWLPTIHAWRSLDDLLNSDVLTSDHVRLTLSPDAEDSLISYPLADKRVMAVLGGELGLHDKELHSLHEKGFSPVSLGPHILRAVTAAIASAGVLSSRFLHAK